MCTFVFSIRILSIVEQPLLKPLWHREINFFFSKNKNQTIIHHFFKNFTKAACEGDWVIIFWIGCIFARLWKRNNNGIVLSSREYMFSENSIIKTEKDFKRVLERYLIIG